MLRNLGVVSVYLRHKEFSAIYFCFVLTEVGYSHDGLQTRNLDQTPSFEFHKTGVNTMEPSRGVCVLETQGVFCNLFLFRF